MTEPTEPDEPATLPRREAEELSPSELEDAKVASVWKRLQAEREKDPEAFAKRALANLRKP